MQIILQVTASTSKKSHGYMMRNLHVAMLQSVVIAIIRLTNELLCFCVQQDVVRMPSMAATVHANIITAKRTVNSLLFREIRCFTKLSQKR